MGSTRKIKVPRDLLAIHEQYKEVQNFFKELEDRDLLGEMFANDLATHTANSVTVTNGTISSGDVSSTRIEDGVYLAVNETGSYTIDYSFTGLTGDPARVEFFGRYQGSPGHTVTAKFFNFNTTIWDDAVAGGQDFPASVTDSFLTFTYPSDSSDYISGGESRFRIEHVSPPNVGHNFFTDFIATLQKSLELPTGGTYFKISGLTDGCQNRTIVDGANGEITVQTTGFYSIYISSSFFGSEDTKFQGHLFVDDVLQANIGASRTIGTAGDVGNIAFGGCLKLNDGNVLDLRVQSTSDNVFIGVEHFNMFIRAIN